MPRPFLTIAGCMILVLSFVNFKIDNSKGAANFYYYKNERIYLNQSNSEIFFMLKNSMSENGFRENLGLFKDKFNTSNFDVNEKMQIVKLNSQESEESLEPMITYLKSIPDFEYVSPVFSLPENFGSSKVRIGYLNELIVQFKPDMPSEDVSGYIQRNNFQIIQKLDLSGGETYSLRISPQLNSVSVANEIFESGIANYSEPNFFQTNLLQNYTPNDQFFSSQWSVKNTGSNVPGGISGTVDCDMDVDSAWDISLGSNAVIVSIVDTGIDTLHPDLSAKIVNGKGYNFYSNNSNSMDDNAHGTCCAGIVAASGNNTIGVSGIAPNAKIFGIKIFNSLGNTTTAAITNGLIYTKTSGCWVSSNSWGGGAAISAADNAIADGVATGRGGKGVVYCFATGNDNASSISWPSNNSNVIAVGGISPCNQRKSGTSCDNETTWGANYGTGLTIVAPCTKIYATDRRGANGYSSTDYFSTFNGTSSATPNASGVCALALGLDSTMRWDTLRARVARLADKVGSYTYNQSGSLGIGGWTTQMGYGKINAYSVLKYTLNNLPPVASTISLAEEGFYDQNTSALRLRDTVRLFLRNSTPPYAIVDSGKTVIDSLTFTGSLTFSKAFSGTYYVTVKHRNAIETWSKNGGEVYTRGFPFAFSFMSAITQAYNSNQAQVDDSPARFALFSGDVNQDGIIDIADNLMIENDASLFIDGYVATDLTGDYWVDIYDAAICDNNSSFFVIVEKP